MPINLKTPVVESREQRLGTVIAWQGQASDLAANPASPVAAAAARKRAASANCRARSPKGRYAASRWSSVRPATCATRC